MKAKTAIKIYDALDNLNQKMEELIKTDENNIINRGMLLL